MKTSKVLFLIEHETILSQLKKMLTANGVI